MTMQTFVVLLIGVFWLEIRLTIIAFYLLEGIIGLPVFSGTPEKGSGITILCWTNNGILIRIFFAAMLCGFLNLIKILFLIF